MKTIFLTTPNRGYAEVRLVRRRDEEHRKFLFVEFQYGDTVENKWVPGELRNVEKIIRNLGEVLDGRGGRTREADPQYDDLVGKAWPKVTFTNKDGSKRWKKLSRPHPTHGDLDLWVQISDVAMVNNIYQHALDEGWFEGSIE